jgi:arginyl-tRNA synthetase
MEDGDEDALRNWRIWRTLSVKKYAEAYEQLNVAFDVYTGESEVGKEWSDKALEHLQKLDLIREDDGAKFVDLEEWKLAKAVIRKQGEFCISDANITDDRRPDGTSIYLTRDIGGAIERYEKYKFDKMIYVISSQQDLHVAQLFKILKLMELPWADRLEHINYGLVQGMSTRKGTAVFLDQIIEEASNVMHDQMQKNERKYAAIGDPELVSREVGISGIKVQDMIAKRFVGHIIARFLALTSLVQYQQLHVQLG